MRSTNNINTIDFDAEAAQGNVFWVVYDMDTHETLMSTDGPEGFKWKALILSAAEAVAEVDDTARFRTLDEARQVAEEAADALAAEYPGDGINLEIHRVRLEMVEMIQDIYCEVEHGVERAAALLWEEEDGEEEDGEEEEEEDEGFEANRFNFNRQREALENLVVSNKKPKAKKSTKKGKGRS